MSWPIPVQPTSTSVSVVTGTTTYDPPAGQIPGSSHIIAAMPVPALPAAPSRAQTSTPVTSTAQESSSGTPPARAPRAPLLSRLRRLTAAAAAHFFVIVSLALLRVERIFELGSASTHSNPIAPPAASLAIWQLARSLIVVLTSLV